MDLYDPACLYYVDMFIMIDRFAQVLPAQAIREISILSSIVTRSEKVAA